MEQDGFIIGHEEIVGSKLTKKKYTITPSGKALVDEWLAESLSSLPPTRDEFAMKVYFMDSAENPLLVALFQEEILRHEEKIGLFAVPVEGVIFRGRVGTGSFRSCLDFRAGHSP